MSNDLPFLTVSNQPSLAESFDFQPSKFFEFELNHIQVKALQKLLPKGYSLEVLTKTRKEGPPKPTKKVFTNEGNAIKRNISNEPSSLTLPPPDLMASSRKISLREKKKHSHLEEKYPDFEALPTTSSKFFKPLSEGARKCLNLLQKLKKHHSAHPFLEPVDVEGLGLIDYYDIVKEPMDISTVEAKLRNGEYPSVLAFATDVRKIWNNAFRYNAKGTPIYIMTTEMANYFEKLYKEVENVSFTDTARDLERRVEKLSKQITDYHHRGGKFGQTSKSSKSSANLDKPMTLQEKKQLGTNIAQLPPEYLRGVWDIVSDSVGSQAHDEIEININDLPVRVSRELEKYVKNKLAQINRAKEKKKGKETVSSKQSFLPTGENMMTIESQQTAATTTEGLVEKENAKTGGDDDDKSSESSFISDSEDGSDDDEKPKKKIMDTFFEKQQDLTSFQAGGHGSMLSSFIVK